jgi:microcystin-dependent protein
MTSIQRQWFELTAHQRPSVGDMKTSAIGIDHMGWLFCDGRALLISEFPQLYNVIGRSFGSNTAADFLLPAPAGRVPGFVGAGTGLTVRTLGSNVGTETHTLTINEMPAHTHGSSNVSGNTNGDGITDLSGAHTHSGTTDAAGWAQASANPAVSATTMDVADNTGTHTHTFTTGQPSVLHHHKIGSTGGGQEHNNMQPTLFVGNMFMYCGRPFYGSNAITPTAPYTAGIYVQSTAAPGSNLA